jgi:hypothetical protein
LAEAIFCASRRLHASQRTRTGTVRKLAAEDSFATKAMSKYAIYALVFPIKIDEGRILL